MAAFPLKVMTADRCFYDGAAERIGVRTTQGDTGILPGHAPYVAAIGTGGLTIIKDGEKRTAVVSGGFVHVSRERTVVLAQACEWADEIDVKCAEQAAERKKAVNRIRVAEKK